MRYTFLSLEFISKNSIFVCSLYIGLLNIIVNKIENIFTLSLGDKLFLFNIKLCSNLLFLLLI